MSLSDAVGDSYLFSYQAFNPTKDFAVVIDASKERLQELIEVFCSQTCRVNEFGELGVVDKICQIIGDGFQECERFDVRSENKELGRK